MDISGKTPPITATPPVERPGQGLKVVQTLSPKPVTAGDTVTLSPQARAVAAARETLATLPEIREEKVAAIRAQIDAGTYVVDSEKIADKMVAEALIDPYLK